MKVKDLIIKGCRKIYRKTFRPEFIDPACEFDRSKSNKYIYDLLVSDKPCMICRYGTTEIGIVTNYLSVHSKESRIKKYIKYITGNTGLPWWDELNVQKMKFFSGIFPESIDTLERFSERYLQDSKEIDLLGSFNYTERFMPLREDVINVHLECLYPFWAELPWTTALEGKKVLVVHPFIETIASQYKKRELIFEDKRILPKYELKLIRAVQSVADAQVPFKDWFEALKYMEDEISKTDFDVCIIGCGAYGLPLAAHVKRIGKKAIHLGGGSQLLWGIKGKRWDNDAYHWDKHPNLYTNYSSLYNDSWVRPSADETPKSAKKVEGACYW